MAQNNLNNSHFGDDYKQWIDSKEGKGWTEVFNSFIQKMLTKEQIEELKNAGDPSYFLN